MVQCPGVKKVLVDRGQLGFQHRIQMLDNRRITSHIRLPGRPASVYLGALWLTASQERSEMSGCRGGG
jgi:hypothetical protein